MSSSISKWAGTVLVATLAAATTAGASPVHTFQPSFTLSGGADDNLLFNGQGGDGVGKVTLRGRYRVRDHLWSASVDGAASLYAFVQQNRRVPLGELTAAWNQHLTRSDDLTIRVRARGSDDPLALAQIGLLGGGGAALGFRSLADYSHQFDERWSVNTLASVTGIRYFETAFITRSGEAGGLYVKPRYRLTRNLSLQATAEGRLFFGQGLIGNAIGVLPGVRYRVARRLFAEVEAGVSYFTDDTGSIPVPVARSLFTWEERWSALRVAASQELTIPNGRAGVLKTQLVEATYHYGIRDWDFGARAGYYRSQSSPRAELWTPGYGIEGSIFRRVTPFLWMGLSALRFERLENAAQPAMSRNAIYLRFDFNSGRP